MYAFFLFLEKIKNLRNLHSNIGKVLDVGWIGRPSQAFPPLEPYVIVSHHTAQAFYFLK